MLNKNLNLPDKIFTDELEQKPTRNGLSDFQDEIFRKMSVEQKLSLLDEFFKFGKELQDLNDRKRKK